MPQHWVGRPGSPTRWLPAVGLAFLLAFGLVQQNSNSASRVRSYVSATQAALAQIDERLGSVPGTAQPVRFGAVGAWETGTIAFAAHFSATAGDASAPATPNAADGPTDYQPRVFLYVAHRQGSGWRAQIEGQPGFAEMAGQGRVAMAGSASAALLATTADTLSTSASAELSLPWGRNQQWRLTGGPHNETGVRNHPWSALDFQPADGKAGKVLAARGGMVIRPCANFIEIRHNDGWATSYYHVRSMAVGAGDHVSRGQFLGYTSTASGCGGSATGPHVHFSLMRYGKFVNVRDQYIGGWLVREGSSQYLGCLVKGDQRKCAPHAKVYNSGSIGARQ